MKNFMRKPFSLPLPLSLITMIFLLSSTISYAGELVISFVQGPVEVQRANKTLWIKAKAGDILRIGDKVRTGKKSRALTTSKEGHRITIKEKTTFEISKLGPREWDFKQGKGKTRLTVAKLLSGRTLKVRTPTAVCSVRGTEFQVTVLDDLSTTLDVFKGVVNFTDAEGIAPELPILENQRSSVQKEESPKPVESIPVEERQKDTLEEEQLKKDFPGEEGEKSENDLEKGKTEEEKSEEDLKEENEKAEAKRDGKELFGEREELRAQLREEIAREADFNLLRDRIESESVFELKAAEYQDSKTLIDAFGQRVRIEEYVTRPTAESFKFVSINTRDNRIDSSFFEVIANKPLPQNLSDAGNLWFSIGNSPPEFYAKQQRWFVTNGIDSVSEISLDGNSKPAFFQDPVVFSNGGNFLNAGGEGGFQTIFSHHYKFINGDINQLEGMWKDSSHRPMDAPGMMWHMIPNPVWSSNQNLPNWKYTFAVTSKNDPNLQEMPTGKMEVSTHDLDPSNPFLGHITEKIAYINFVDLNNNGQFDPSVDLLFSDLNRNGKLDFNNSLIPDEPTGMDPLMIAQNPWAVEIKEKFLVNDSGKVVDFSEIGLPSLGQGSQNKGEIAAAFEKVNFEMVWKSSEFKSDKIDIVLTPRIFIQSDQLELKTKDQQSGPHN